MHGARCRVRLRREGVHGLTLTLTLTLALTLALTLTLACDAREYMAFWKLSMADCISSPPMSGGKASAIWWAI